MNTANNRVDRYYPLLIGAAILLLVLTFVVGISVGSVNWPWSEIINALFAADAQGLQQKIIWDVRMPRVVMAALTGAGLSVTGAILQSVTRNPLADPYLFGISSGASFGAVLILSSVSAATVSLTFGALIGAAVSVVLMLTLAGRAVFNVEKLLLSGVAVSFMMSALTSLVLYFSQPEVSATLLFWMMGSFSASTWASLPFPAVTLFVGLSLFVLYRRWLAALQAGEESAQTLGIPVNQLRLGMLLVCSSITAVLVAHVGGIGFVGLMIPHISRFIVGSQIHRVIIFSSLLGASFMIWVDLIARSLLPNQVLPVGIVTSAIGSCFFFVILKRREMP